MKTCNGTPPSISTAKINYGISHRLAITPRSAPHVARNTTALIGHLLRTYHLYWNGVSNMAITRAWHVHCLPLDQFWRVFALTSLSKLQDAHMNARDTLNRGCTCMWTSCCVSGARGCEQAIRSVRVSCSFGHFVTTISGTDSSRSVHRAAAI